MSARNSAKAIIISCGRLLVNRCQSRFGEYYTLPGGGQRDGETLLEAVRREVLEETGYTVKPMRLSGLYERLASSHPEGNGHKLYFVFLCRLENRSRIRPSETDRFQIGFEWIPLWDAANRNLFPRAIRDNLGILTGPGETIYLGSEREPDRTAVNPD